MLRLPRELRRRGRAAQAAAVKHADASRSSARPQGRPFIRGGALAMMTVGSVGYLGSTPATAVFGLASVFLYVLPALVFLLPVSLVAAELASGWEGGVYNWVREGLSARMGLVAVWCQFAQTIFYYPALLAYVGSTLAYIIDPTLASNGIYTAAIIVVLFWSGVPGLLPGRWVCGRSLLERHRDWNADPRSGPCRARRRLPDPGQ